MNISNSTIWRYFVVKIRVALSSLGAQLEIVSLGNAAQIQNMLWHVIAAQKVEEVWYPEGKAKLKEEIRNRMNTILGEEKILVVYLEEFFPNS